MGKVYDNEIIYNYSPAHTLNWFMRKYPNPFATHVFSVDTIERTVDPVTGVLRTERVIGVQQGAPKWITKLFQLPETAYVREVVFIEPDTPTATCLSMNLNLAQYVSCLESISYTPFPAGAGRDAPATLFKQHAYMHSQFTSRFVARKIEKASVDRFASNADIGKQGFEWVLSRGREIANRVNGSSCRNL